MTEIDPELVADLAPQSPGVVFWSQMKKSPLAIVGGALLALFYLLALLAPFVAPYPQEEMDRSKYFHPPQGLHWIDSSGRFHLGPFVRATALTDREAFRYTEVASREMP